MLLVQKVITLKTKVLVSQQPMVWKYRPGIWTYQIIELVVVLSHVNTECTCLYDLLPHRFVNRSSQTHLSKSYFSFLHNVSKMLSMRNMLSICLPYSSLRSKNFPQLCNTAMKRSILLPVDSPIWHTKGRERPILFYPPVFLKNRPSSLVEWKTTTIIYP